MQFQVWLTDSRLMPNQMGIGISSVSYWTEPTVVTVEAEQAHVTKDGDLEFMGHVRWDDGFVRRASVMGFARGQWSRWKLIT